MMMTRFASFLAVAMLAVGAVNGFVVVVPSSSSSSSSSSVVMTAKKGAAVDQEVDYDGKSSESQMVLNSIMMHMRCEVVGRRRELKFAFGFWIQNNDHGS
jgi:spore coat protein CotH